MLQPGGAAHIYHWVIGAVEVLAGQGYRSQRYAFARVKYEGREEEQEEERVELHCDWDPVQERPQDFDIEGVNR